MREITDNNKLREVQLKILETVAEFCEENNIRYFLAGGTLLGAIRHKGYIPWDDDIDIVMFRKDFDRFCAEFNQNRTDSIRIAYYKNMKDFHYTFAKVMDTKTRFVEDIDHYLKIGINIDLFVLDDLPTDNLRFFLWERYISLYRNILKVKLIKKSKTRSILKELVLLIGKKVFAPVPYYFLCRKINEVSTIYSQRECNSEKVACVTTMIYGSREVYCRKWFDTGAKAEFEGRDYSVPGGYDKILRSLYGDYMELPSMEERTSHHSFRAYR